MMLVHAFINLYVNKNIEYLYMLYKYTYDTYDTCTIYYIDVCMGIYNRIVYTCGIDSGQDRS